MPMFAESLELEATCAWGVVVGGQNSWMPFWKGIAYRVRKAPIPGRTLLSVIDS